MRIGDRIEVHSRFTDSWATGFEIADVVDGGYVVRRTSDGALLPNVTGESDVRAVRTG